MVVFVVEILVPLVGSLVGALGLDSDPYDRSYFRIGGFIIAAAPLVDILRIHALSQLEHSDWHESYRSVRRSRVFADLGLTVVLAVLAVVYPLAIVPLIVAVLVIFVVSQYV